MKRFYTKCIIVGLFVLAGLCLWFMRQEEIFSRSGMAMNTIIRMSIEAHNDSVLDDAYTLLASLDNSMSMYNPSSDISRVNSLAGVRDVDVNHYVCDAVRHSVGLYSLTEGTFNPLIGSVTKLWKINKFDGNIPSQQSLDEAVKLTDINNLVISSDDNIFLKHKGCVLDLGGVAKGYAGDVIAKLFRDNGIKSALIDLGGNICVVGKNFEGEKWKIGIRDPFNPDSAPAMAVSVKDCSVITSGNYERFKIADGKKYSHFFDPKTGQSIMNDLLSVTVIDEDGALADGLATAFMAMGFEKARSMSSKLGVKAVLIRNDKTIHASHALEDSVHMVKFQIEFF